jgi:hypothetical protein
MKLKPITFVCQAVIPKTGAEICAEIADLARWPEFAGYGPLPGIASAVYERRTPDMVGSRIRVVNRDGSGHVEEVVVWVVGERVGLKLFAFTPPLGRLATHFMEEWVLEARGEGEGEGNTAVARHFALYPVSHATRPLLWLISLLFRRAIAHHLRQIAQEIMP